MSVPRLVRYLRNFVILILLLVLIFLGAVYAAIRNESFVKTYLIPELSTRLGVSLSVGSIDIEPFTGLLIEGLRVKTGKEELLKLKRGEIRYSLRELLAGPYVVESLALDGVDLRLRQNPNGDWNLPQSKSDTPPSPTSNSSENPGFQVKNFAIQDSQILIERLHEDGRIDTELDLKDLGFRSPALSNMRPTKLEFATAGGLKLGEDLQFSAGKFGIGGSVDFNRALAVQQVNFVIDFKEVRGRVGEKDFEDLALGAEFALRFEKDGIALEVPKLELGQAQNSLLALSGEGKFGREDFSSEIKANVSNVSAELLHFLSPETEVIQELRLEATLEARKKEEELDAVLKFQNASLNLKETLPGRVAPLRVRDLSVSANSKGELSNLAGLHAQLSLVAAEVDFDTLVIRELGTEASLEEEVLEISKLKFKEGNGEFSGFARVANVFEKKDFSLLLEGQNFDYAPLLEMFDESGQEQKLGGQITSLRLRAKGRAENERVLKKSLNASLKIEGEDVDIPGYLQDVPPFNLIFLPFTTLKKVSGTLGTFLLPEKVMGAISRIGEVLKESGKLHLDEFRMQADAENEKVKVSNTRFNPNLLPTVEFEGDIGLDERVDLVTRLKLVGVWVPLPITGWLNTPLPDVAAFVPELVKALGLSVAEVGEGVLKVGEGIGGVFKTKKEEEAESTEVQEKGAEKAPEVPQPVLR